MFKFKKYTSVHFILALLLIYLSAPYFVWNLPMKNVINLLVKIAVIAICAKHIKKLDKVDTMLIFLYVFVWIIFMIKLYDNGQNFYGMLDSVPISFLFIIPFIERKFGEQVLNQYINIYSVIILVSVCIWLLGFVLPIPNTGMITHSETLRTYNSYPFLVVEQLSLDSFRFYGVFDEPGVVGTIGVALLCLLRFNFRDKRTWIILLSGICSMSFFFYAAILVYSIIYLCFIKKKIFQAILIVAFSVIFFNKTKDNEIFRETIWDRFEWSEEDGKFEGDNRTSNESEAYFESIKGTSEYYLGIRDIEHYWKLSKGTSSYKNVIAIYGAIFFYLYCLFFILYAYKYKPGFAYFLLFCFIFGLNMYQRSNVYSVLWLFLYTAMAREFIINSKDDKRKLLNNKYEISN